MNKPKVTMAEISEAPNLQELKDKFGVSEDDVIIAYGDTIYVKGKSLTADLLLHELVHCERQGFTKSGAQRWYAMYLRDEKFRLNEEIIAYHQQYDYCCKVYKDRNVRVRILSRLAQQLASSQYGKVIHHGEAMDRIKEGKLLT